MARIHKLILTLCAIIPIVIGQCTLQRAEVLFRRSVYEFSVDLVRRIAEDNEGHFIASTLSPWTLLSAVSLGAADDTLSQIQQVLKHHRHKCFNNKYLELAKQIASSSNGATLEHSSNLFMDHSMILKERFRNQLTKTGVCDITPLSFDDFNRAAGIINNYVKEATHGVIDEIISPSDLEGVYLIMVDALYFKGSWRKAFLPEETEASTFYDAHRNPIGEVNLMFANNEFNITTIDAIEATVLELPYGHDDRFSMLLFLPNDDVPLINVIGALKKISLGSIFGLFQREGGPKKVFVQIPRFKITSDLDNLKELLIDMGLRDMFDANRARFPEISDYQLHVSSFIQKADVEVTEEGTVAAAVTEMGFSFRSSVQAENFLANKPFFFMIVDRKTEVPVFSGAYSKPKLF
ncbi:ovalbumin-related protein X-like [Ostrinia nubilalis]|uniref:ovalbumin-related protein X-like n=2 Tax=Ostrinia TaxID=29056 RepID=UPI00308246C4